MSGKPSITEEAEMERLANAKRKRQELHLLSMKKPTLIDDIRARMVTPKNPLPLNALPGWKDRRLDAKFPAIPAPDGTFTISQGELGEKLFIAKPSQGFDTRDPLIIDTPLTYDALHDPNLKEFFQTHPLVCRQLVQLGLVSNEGKVLCSLQEFNKYRMYLSRIHNNDVAREKERMESWERCEQEHVKQLQQYIDREVKRQADEERRKRREKNLADIKARNKMIKLRELEHPCNYIKEKRTIEAKLRKAKRDAVRKNVINRIKRMRDAEKRRTRHLILEWICKDEFREKLRNVIKLEKEVNRQEDLAYFVDNKRSFQEKKLKYQKALLKRDQMENECRVTKRYENYLQKRIEGDRRAIAIREMIEKKAKRTYYLMEKYGRRWLELTRKYSSSPLHTSAWHIRNILHAMVQYVKLESGVRSFTGFLRDIIRMKSQDSEIDPETLAAVTSILDTLVDRSYKEFVRRATSCLVDFVVDEARKKCLKVLCEEGFDTKDLEIPIYTIKKRDKINLPKPNYPCTGPCAQFGQKGPDWSNDCAQELEWLHGILCIKLLKKLTNKMKRMTCTQDNLENLENRVKQARGSPLVRNAIDTVCEVVVNKIGGAGPSSSDPQKKQRKQIDRATSNMVNSVLGPEKPKRIQRGDGPGRNKPDGPQKVGPEPTKKTRRPPSRQRRVDQSTNIDTTDESGSERGVQVVPTRNDEKVGPDRGVHKGTNSLGSGKSLVDQGTTVPKKPATSNKGIGGGSPAVNQGVGPPAKINKHKGVNALTTTTTVDQGSDRLEPAQNTTAGTEPPPNIDEATDIKPPNGSNKESQENPPITDQVTEPLENPKTEVGTDPEDNPNKATDGPPPVPTKDDETGPDNDDSQHHKESQQERPSLVNKETEPQNQPQKEEAGTDPQRGQNQGTDGPPPTQNGEVATEPEATTIGKNDETQEPVKVDIDPETESVTQVNQGSQPSPGVHEETEKRPSVTDNQTDPVKTPSDDNGTNPPETQNQSTDGPPPPQETEHGTGPEAPLNQGDETNEPTLVESNTETEPHQENETDTPPRPETVDQEIGRKTPSDSQNQGSQPSPGVHEETQKRPSVTDTQTDPIKVPSEDAQTNPQPGQNQGIDGPPPTEKTDDGTEPETHRNESVETSEPAKVDTNEETEPHSDKPTDTIPRQEERDQDVGPDRPVDEECQPGTIDEFGRICKDKGVGEPWTLVCDDSMTTDRPDQQENCTEWDYAVIPEDDLSRVVSEKLNQLLCNLNSTLVKECLDNSGDCGPSSSQKCDEEEVAGPSCPPSVDLDCSVSLQIDEILNRELADLRENEFCSQNVGKIIEDTCRGLETQEAVDKCLEEASRKLREQCDTLSNDSDKKKCMVEADKLQSASENGGDEQSMTRGGGGGCGEINGRDVDCKQCDEDLSLAVDCLVDSVLNEQTSRLCKELQIVGSGDDNDISQILTSDNVSRISSAMVRDALCKQACREEVLDQARLISSVPISASPVVQGSVRDKLNHIRSILDEVKAELGQVGVCRQSDLQQQQQQLPSTSSNGKTQTSSNSSNNAKNDTKKS